MYTVKEIFRTLQGEGAHTGRTAVFLRFAGCNLWSGLERDRAGATCTFCDTDFVGIGPDGGKFSTPDALAEAVARCWGDEAADARVPRRQHDSPDAAIGRFVVCTGGEPLLQLDGALIEALHARGFVVAVETNGTLPPPPGVDWLCVSPKAGATLVVEAGQELKLVFPQDSAPPERYEALSFDHFFLQPMDGPDVAANTAAAVRFCLTHPRWRLSLQTHKLLGIR